MVKAFAEFGVTKQMIEKRIQRRLDSVTPANMVALKKVYASLRDGKNKVNVQVVLPFTPDRFHVMAMQQFGRVSGTEDTSIEVRGVKRDDLSSLARPFWVKRIEPLKGD